MKRNTLTICLAALMLACTGCASEEGTDLTGAVNHVAPPAGAAGDAVTGGDAAEDAGGKEMDAAGEDAAEGGIVPDADVESTVSQQQTEKLLTAGEWRDHENWGFLMNLVGTGHLTLPEFGIDLLHRVSVTATDPAGNVLPNVKAELLDAKGNVLWTAMTDQAGHAYLFGAAGTSVHLTCAGAEQTIALDAEQPITLETSQETDPQAQQEQETQSQQQSPTDTELNTAAAGNHQVTAVLDIAPPRYEDMQVMFILDTTGSMGDEMLYLQSDFSSIAEEAGDENTSYAVSFYRDKGDDYVTKCGKFTKDTGEIRRQLNAETADGGGDTPEAVAEVLTETMTGDLWEEETVKVAFLIYDAPPHDGTEAALCEAMRQAAAKGIHLVPVVSSNGSRETELFGRAAAICTNASYVFLTDDSGIGDSHLEPIIGDYEVEPLHDIIVRLIREYRQ